jgi:hypothetical protein
LRLTSAVESVLTNEHSVFTPGLLSAVFTFNTQGSILWDYGESRVMEILRVQKQVVLQMFVKVERGYLL